MDSFIKKKIDDIIKFSERQGAKFNEHEKELFTNELIRLHTASLEQARTAVYDAISDEIHKIL